LKIKIVFVNVVLAAQTAKLCQLLDNAKRMRRRNQVIFEIFPPYVALIVTAW
jgi:hypothetical protein